MLTDLYIIFLVVSGVILMAGLVATPILLNAYIKSSDKDFYESNHRPGGTR